MLNFPNVEYCLTKSWVIPATGEADAHVQVNHALHCMLQRSAVTRNVAEPCSCLDKVIVPLPGMVLQLQLALRSMGFAALWPVHLLMRKEEA